MNALADFAEIVTEEQALAKHTSLGIGGPAEYLARPRQIEELAKLVQTCRSEGIPFAIMGGGSNLLVPDEGVRGVVIALTEPAFREISATGTTIRAGAGALLSDLIAEASRASASGLEVLVGIPGTVGGALRKNAGDRGGDVGQYVKEVTVMHDGGDVVVRGRADISFSYGQSDLDDALILDATFELIEDNQDQIVRRIKKLWISKKATQPFGFQAAGYIFRDPRGQSAVELIDRVSLRGTRVGGAELSERDPRFIVAHDPCSSRDVLRLIDLVRSRVAEVTGVSLELQIDVW
ncbi:UDP-N-acetylenolpyruvoylglucosamine reductase MurB [Planctomycetes bacterium Pan216]|uniref:UDP-N-acetylenolpyruvoylglucosamine reductase n=1 Tax=Kolteria novifilia TaxID=2527975 RepID=A0A518B391_9BACT|nr:UDP-N-acetylenolpyruvoylglucosamine reductase MurB [Planctomycetes bacterium Pan216]